LGENEFTLDEQSRQKKFDSFKYHQLRVAVRPEKFDY